MKKQFSKIISFISIKTPIAAISVVIIASVLLWIIFNFITIPHYVKYQGRIAADNGIFYIGIDLSESESKFNNSQNILWYNNEQSKRYKGKIIGLDYDTLKIENIDKSVNLNTLAGSDVFVEIQIGQKKVLEKILKNK